MSGECNNCETRQRIGKDARCLVCIYFNANIFGTGIGPSETEVYNAKVLEEIKAKRKQTKINTSLKSNKNVKDVINTVNLLMIFSKKNMIIGKILV